MYKINHTLFLMNLLWQSQRTYIIHDKTSTYIATYDVAGRMAVVLSYNDSRPIMFILSCHVTHRKQIHQINKNQGVKPTSM